MKEFYCRMSILFWSRTLRITNRVQNLEYAIRDVVKYAIELEKKGKEVLYLNIGDPMNFDFDTPEHVKES